jgi:hypothetical protein
MANELLDFVMSLVRDSDAAARYGADPDGALAAAGLSGVTSADVNTLLPVVSDSLAMTAPPVGGTGGAEGNVWTGGVATAPFDAFTPHSGAPQTMAQQPVISSSEAASPQGVDDPWFGTDPQVSAVDPAPLPAIDTGYDAPAVWDGAESAIGDSHAPFGHHAPDDHGFTGFELLD